MRVGVLFCFSSSINANGELWNVFHLNCEKRIRFTHVQQLWMNRTLNRSGVAVCVYRNCSPSGICDETTFLGILKWIELVSIGFYTSKTDLIFIRYSQFLIGIKMHRAQEGWFNHQVATKAASSAIATLLRLRTITIYLSIPFEYFNLIKIQLHIMQLSQIHTLIID